VYDIYERMVAFRRCLDPNAPNTGGQENPYAAQALRPKL